MSRKKLLNKYHNLTNGTTIVELTQGQYTLVDTEDWERLKRFKWCAHYSKNINSYYVVSNQNGKQLALHREIFGLVDPLVKVDHINHDTLDNRKQSLRVVTDTQNQCNRRKRNNQSGLVGVIIEKRFSTPYYYPRIRVNGKTKYLGCFKDPIEAARIRDLAAIEYHGEFHGDLNFNNKKVG